MPLASTRANSARSLRSPKGLVNEEPLRERRWAILALAQYRCARQVDALRSIARARRVLGELGIDPGSELVELEAAILRQDPALSIVPEAAAASAAARTRVWLRTTRTTPMGSSVVTPRSWPASNDCGPHRCSWSPGRRDAASHRWCAPGWFLPFAATAPTWWCSRRARIPAAALAETAIIRRRRRLGGRPVRGTLHAHGIP